MNKGISFFFGYKTNYKKRAQLIKKAGFDSIISNADERFNKQNGNIRKQIKIFKKENLNLSSLHMRYKQEDLKNFFLDNNIGNKLEKNLIKDLKIAKKYGFTCVVVHLEGEFSSVGLERLKRVLKVCEKLDVPLAIENIEYQELFVQIFDSIDNKYLRFCYDSGHNNCFDPEFSYLDKYGDKLICLHLHDNNGEQDQHTLNKYGTIDWDTLAKKLAKCPEVSLDYELLMCKKVNESEEEALQICLKQAKELEEKINYYKGER